VAEHLHAGADQVVLQIVGDVPRDLPVQDAARLATLLLAEPPVHVPRQGGSQVSRHGETLLS
jgi:hypothetical protein